VKMCETDVDFSLALNREFKFISSFFPTFWSGYIIVVSGLTPHAETTDLHRLLHQFPWLSNILAYKHPSFYLLPTMLSLLSNGWFTQSHPYFAYF
jgi:hypothetical protein